METGRYYYSPVQWAARRQITAGQTATTFAPNAPCTRAQVVTFLWRAAGSPEPESRSIPFSDVRSGAYYEKAVLWAVEQGITLGKTADSFDPGGVVTRGQAVTFLYRASGAKPAGNRPFTDVAAGSYCYDAVNWAAATGVTSGRSDTIFAPGDACSRANIVTFLYKHFVK